MFQHGKHLQKPQYSKIITSVGLAVWILGNLFGMYMVYITLDITALSWIIGSSNAVAIMIYRAYTKKAQAENMIKLRMQYGADADFVLRNMKGADESAFGGNIDSALDEFASFKESFKDALNF